MFAGGLGIVHVKREMPGANAVGLRLQQQVQRLPAPQIEPEHDEVKRLWRSDFFETQQLAIEMTAARDVGDDDGTVIHMGDVHLTLNQSAFLSRAKRKWRWFTNLVQACHRRSE